MLDMSWGEIMVIGSAALIVIGPKDLPRALRTLGNMTAKLRRMAAEFQGQFNEAMREAELEEVRQQIKGVNDSVSSLNAGLNPIQTIRDELKNAVEAPSASPHATPVPAAPDTATQAAANAPTVDPVIDLPPPMDIDPAQAIAESIRREAATETAVADHTAPEKSDVKAG